MYKVVLLLLCLTSAVSASQWSQWHGPNRDAVSSETGLMKQWPKEGPEMLWHLQGIGEGWSTVSISDDTIYTTGKIDKDEILFAIDLKGNMKWQKTYGKPWNRSFPGARTTPTLDGDNIYVISGSGQVVCMSSENGDINWSVDGYNEFNGKYGNWGMAESPIVDDTKVYFTVCGSETTVVAFNKKTGDVVWKSETLNDQNAYVSPILVNHNDIKMIMGVSGNYIFGVDSADGNMLWKVKYSDIKPSRRGFDINANTPIYKDGKVFVTSGYDHVGVLLEVSENGKSADVLWTSSDLDAHHGGAVLLDGYIYGTSWEGNGDGSWICLDWKTGETKYKHHWNNKGSIFFADDMLYCFEEKKGNIALVKPIPQKFDIVSSFQVPYGKSPYWAHPVVLDGVLYLRNGEYLMAYDIKSK